MHTTSKSARELESTGEKDDLKKSTVETTITKKYAEPKQLESTMAGT